METDDGLIALLQKTGVFSTLELCNLADIPSYLTSRSFQAGEIIFSDDDNGDCLYIVRRGEVAVSQKDLHDGREEIARYGEGSCFGEMDMLMSSMRNAEARAIVNSELLRFPAEGKTIFDFYDDYPQTAAYLLHRFLQLAAGRIRVSNTILRENSPWVQEMRNQVYRDKLTGLYNKTYLTEQLPSFLKDPDKPLSLLNIKPDNFKAINDTYGHEAGDQTLVVCAVALSHFVPSTSVLCRFAGNEMALILPDADADHAVEFAKQIRHLYNTLDLSKVIGPAGAPGGDFRLSVSIGIALWPKHAVGGELGERSAALIEAAHSLPLVGRARGGNLILFPEDNQ